MSTMKTLFYDQLCTYYLCKESFYVRTPAMSPLFAIDNVEFLQR